MDLERCCRIKTKHFRNMFSNVNSFESSARLEASECCGEALSKLANLGVFWCPGVTAYTFPAMSSQPSAHLPGGSKRMRCQLARLQSQHMSLQSLNLQKPSLQQLSFTKASVSPGGYLFVQSTVSGRLNSKGGRPRSSTQPNAIYHAQVDMYIFFFGGGGFKGIPGHESSANAPTCDKRHASCQSSFKTCKPACFCLPTMKGSGRLIKSLANIRHFHTG